MFKKISDAIQDGIFEFFYAIEKKKRRDAYLALKMELFIKSYEGEIWNPDANIGIGIMPSAGRSSNDLGTYLNIHKYYVRKVYRDGRTQFIYFSNIRDAQNFVDRSDPNHKYISELIGPYHLPMGHDDRFR